MASLEMTIRLPSGGSKNLTAPLADPTSLKHVHTAILKMKEESNAYLTEQVNKEKTQKDNTNDSNCIHADNMEEEEDEEEEDEDDNTEAPVEKKPKT